ncbi:hypothetical protein BegalDRAFT_0262 [Beggiatoa alba B18LD]|uniref:Uncharacterized protein n=1 Tax=Beggiatoa alba B18LD TaxID=395493 RepID=I3CC41_9GAMM|nr:hypothetical protein [Beggiatoa alba]EIJ41184.1 hypothetical protein BegalDRAFT_0262 [Beggiatoa alba B18LD]
MSTVFISGSRNLSRLTSPVSARLQNLIMLQFNIVVGDANGADKAVQHYLYSQHYTSVKVFCAGHVCRNNIGNWEVEHVIVDPKLSGRAFYTQKDKAMADIADYGFVIWDGKSQGAFNNIVTLLTQQKKVLLYFAPKQLFHTLRTVSEIQTIIEQEKQKEEIISIQTPLSLFQPTA